MYWNLYKVGHITDPKVQYRKLVIACHSLLTIWLCAKVISLIRSLRSHNVSTLLCRRKTACVHSILHLPSSADLFFSSPSKACPISLGNVWQRFKWKHEEFSSYLQSAHEQTWKCRWCCYWLCPKEFASDLLQKGKQQKVGKWWKTKPFKCNILDKALQRKSICF